MKFRNVNDALPALASDLLRYGSKVPSRAGMTQELTFQHIEITHPLEREIVVAGRKANLAAQIAETMWVLAGRNDVEWLSHYLPRAAEFSDDGNTWRAGYGPRLRGWATGESILDVDQLRNVVELLIKDPSTRRAVISLWDPTSDCTESKDIPCNNWLHFLSRDGVLELHVAIRSNDLIWGWSGINQFEWSVLLEVVAHYAHLKAGSILYSVSSLHMYDRHFEMARKLERAGGIETVGTPRFDPASHPRTAGEDFGFDALIQLWFEMEERIRNRSDQFLDSDIHDFPEPMMRSWLRVLRWWWTGDPVYLALLEGTRLRRAALAGMPPRWTAPKAVEVDQARERAFQRAADINSFIEEVCRLHDEKHAAYGDSWKRRGEMFSILPNIARKADRLGSGDTTDENQTDTVVDLMVYLAKYHAWLNGAADSNTTDAANAVLRSLVHELNFNEVHTVLILEDALKSGVDRLLAAVEGGAHLNEKLVRVRTMLPLAYELAERRWQATPALFARPAGDDYAGADHE